MKSFFTIIALAATATSIVAAPLDSDKGSKKEKDTANLHFSDGGQDPDGNSCEKISDNFGHWKVLCYAPGDKGIVGDEPAGIYGSGYKFVGMDKDGNFVALYGPTDAPIAIVVSPEDSTATIENPSKVKGLGPLQPGDSINGHVVPEQKLPPGQHLSPIPYDGADSSENDSSDSEDDSDGDLF